MNRSLIKVCNLLILLLPLRAAGDIEAATSAYENGDYPTALELFADLADEGNTVAQYNLAFMYYGGEGVDQDYQRAFYWFEKAAKSGYPRAQDILGYMYTHGYGVKASRVRAYVWYSLAAENGIFLADEIRGKLAVEMGQAEKSQAEILAREYSRKYLKPTANK